MKEPYFALKGSCNASGAQATARYPRWSTLSCAAPMPTRSCGASCSRPSRYTTLNETKRNETNAMVLATLPVCQKKERGRERTARKRALYFP